MNDNKRLERVSDGWIAGICGGFADYFGWDRDLTRIAYLLLSLFSAGFPGLLVYLCLWLVMPKQI